MGIIWGVYVAIILMIMVFYNEYRLHYRCMLLHLNKWEWKEIDGVWGYEKNHHFISYKRLKIIPSKIFKRKLEQY